MITPLDIEKKEFSKGVRGYKEDEVDDFLDLIIADLEKLLTENKSMKLQIADLTEKVQSSTGTNESVLETLETAKKLMTDISASAERRAEVLLKNAKLDADLIQRDAKESVKRLTDEAENLKSKVGRYKERYRKFLEDELDRFDTVSEDLFADIEREFMPASMAQKEDLGEEKKGRETMVFGDRIPEKKEEKKQDLTKTIIV